MSVRIKDLDIQINQLLEKKYKIENCKNPFLMSYWYKKSELQKIKDVFYIICQMNFTKVLFPETKSLNFTFFDVFDPNLEYYIFDDNYIPLGKFLREFHHTEMLSITDPVEIKYIRAIFENDSTGSTIYAHNNMFVYRTIYVKN